MSNQCLLLFNLTPFSFSKRTFLIFSVMLAYFPFPLSIGPTLGPPWQSSGPYYWNMYILHSFPIIELILLLVAFKALWNIVGFQPLDRAAVILSWGCGWCYNLIVNRCHHFIAGSQGYCWFIVWWDHQVSKRCSCSKRYQQIWRSTTKPTEVKTKTFNLGLHLFRIVHWMILISVPGLGCKISQEKTTDALIGHLAICCLKILTNLSF